MDIGSAMFFQEIMGFMTLLIIAGLFINFFETRRTKQYRVALSDMYVAAKIRQIASKEDIDLGKEYTEYKSWTKKAKLDSGYYGFDDVVEKELKEKVNKPIKPEKK